MSEAGFHAELFSSLIAAGHTVKFRGFNAIDLYLGLPTLPFVKVETNADIAALARLMENLRYPGVEIADCASDTRDGTCYFTCLDKDEQDEYSFPLLSFAYDWQTRHFNDLLGVYPLLREIRGSLDHFSEDTSDAAAHFGKIDSNQNAVIQEAGRCRVIMDAALLMARYGFNVVVPAAVAEAFANNTPCSPPGPETQRAFLSCLLVSPRPELGLEFLKRSGFLREHWPELAALDEVDHSKEFHPEGNVWNHTLETFRYRKPGSGGAFDLRLSLGLLLHDAGKPISASYGSRRFDGHAELGARAAARFLELLGFEPSIVQDIYYLVKNHMLPAALKRLPLSKTSEIMASPLFPTLMELYRCDESSSFKGLEDYYENSAAYHAYLKNAKNPYRTADGKKFNHKPH
jgi:poly(A) polymerase